MTGRNGKVVLQGIVVLLALILVFTLLPACAAQPPGQTNIQILTGKFGGTIYIMGAGLAELINTHSTWLRATSLESMGCTDDIMRDADDPTARRLYLRGVDSGVLKFAEDGVFPFDKKYTGLKHLMLVFSPLNAMFVVDPNIKTPEDLIGKAVNMGPRGSGTYTWSRLCVDYAWGLEGKYKEVNLGYAEAKDCLMDGTVDAALGIISIVLSPEGQVRFALHPSFVEPWELKPGAHFISLSEADFEKGMEAMGAYGTFFEVPAGALGSKQATPVGTAVTLLNFSAYSEMDEEIGYEICRVAHEHIEEIAALHGALKVLNANTMGWLIAKTEADVHPGALKYYKEHDLPIWIGGESPF